ncbi:MAG: hypothetical protein QOF48_2425 [Verrucomicrobiota bacterium]
MKTVLIIEDDRAVAATYRHKFKEAGFNVEVAPDGIEGVRMVAALQPDAVVLDLLMPRLDGIEVLKFIRGHPEINATPVVVFSNSYMTNLVESAWRAGADECLMKASTMPAKLLDTVNKVISRPNKRRSAAPAAESTPMAAAPLAINPLGFAIPGHVLAGKPADVSSPPPQPRSPVASAPTPPTSIIFEPPHQPATAPRREPPSRPLPAAGDRFTITYAEPATESRKSGSSTSFFVSGTKLIAEPDTEFHAQIRELFLNGSAARLETIRELASAFMQAGDETLRAQQLDTLFRKIHALAGNAGLAGCTGIAHFASTFEVLLKELRDQPAWINPSTLNTVNRSVEALEGMLITAAQQDNPELPRLSALVIEADASSSRTAVAALESAQIRTTASEDPVYAIGLLATTDYDILVTGIHLQDMTGFELLAQMEALPRHARTPVIFVTSHDNFGSYQLDGLVAQHDLIAKPFPPIELTLKALAAAQRMRLQP